MRLPDYANRDANGNHLANRDNPNHHSHPNHDYADHDTYANYHAHGNSNRDSRYNSYRDAGHIPDRDANRDSVKATWIKTPLRNWF